MISKLSLQIFVYFLALPSLYFDRSLLFYCFVLVNVNVNVLHFFVALRVIHVHFHQTSVMPSLF